MSAKLLTILQVEMRGEESFEFDVSKLTWIGSNTPTWSRRRVPIQRRAFQRDAIERESFQR